jgi:hypothetical protein
MLGVNCLIGGSQVTDEELDEIFAALSAILVDSGLGWVVAQVNEHIQLGQIVTRTFHHGEPEEVAALEFSTKPTRNTFVGTDPYGAAQRVELLISAITVALVDTAALERAVGHFFAGELQGSDSAEVVSAPDQEVSGGSALVIAGGNDPAVTVEERIMPLLNELSRRIAQP